MVSIPKEYEKNIFPFFLKETESKIFPNDLRLFVNETCPFRCSFPQTKIPWCHSIEITDIYQKTYPKEHFLRIAGLFLSEFNINKIKIAGMEPTQYRWLVELIKDLSDLGYEDISMTTNGYDLKNKITDLIKAGLSRITVSIHSLNRSLYKQITGRDFLLKVLDALEIAKKESIKVSLNRVLFRKINDSLDNYFAYCLRNGFNARIYHLIWHPGIPNELFKTYYVSPLNVLIQYKEEIHSCKKIEYLIPQRDRYTIDFGSGLKTQFDIFHPKSKLSVCKRCHYQELCQEGYLGYGFEVLPEGILNPCYLRNDLAIDLRSLMEWRG